MKRNRVCLGKYISEYSARNGKRDDIPKYSVTTERGFCRDFFVNKAERKDLRLCRIVPHGYFAYNPSRINVGAVAWQRSAEQVLVSSIYYVFSVSGELDSRFLLYFLKSGVARQMMEAKMEGSVRPHLKMEMLKQITIPEMTMEEQKHCVETLDKVQRLIALRRSQMEELDRLITARFIELFGDGEAEEKT